MTAVIEQTAARTLIDSTLFDRLTARIANEHQAPIDYAERIMDQALAFLAVSADHLGEPLAPTPAVDIGWHAFILYTREYAEFCNLVAGRFIHHVPNDAPNALPGRGTPVEARARTVKAIQRAGFLVDGELWTDVAAKCSPGDAEDGCCAASGVDGNENTENQTPPPVR
ncbi:hypothetical protein [Saccharopolyspora sp. ASAGF58]|uniref:glycine-rich domain-containing protein n=1 Tax=Saccharopolyspora sp. ASAGF58 TaxID=2719023 RepID=UPI0014402207|nr:hypothetical protein [Saccharopolyspora sp. ASAGF58]QIZ35547.1 hypothetical protein FDZ84_13650 [Saccharopolyspora sp. ASAGF58]